MNNPEPKPDKLSVQLKKVLENRAEESLSVRELLGALRGSPYLLLMTFLCLPFLIPVAIPGVSMPVGVLVIAFGLRMMMGFAPVLPRRVAAFRLPIKLLKAVVFGTSALLKLVEGVSAPRLLFLSKPGWLMNLYGVLIFLTGLLLILPLPIPFSNFFPALTLILFSLGLIERDGAFILAGLLCFVATLGFMGLIFWGGKEMLTWLSENMGWTIFRGGT